MRTLARRPEANPPIARLASTRTGATRPTDLKFAHAAQGTVPPGHDFSRIPVLRPAAADSVAVRETPDQDVARDRQAFVLSPLHLAAALGPDGDPIHDVLIEQFRRERGLPASPEGPSDAAIKYKLAPQAARATASIVYVSFTNARPPVVPDHSLANPGPAGGADRAGYTQATIKKRMTIDWEFGTTAPDGRVPVHVRSLNVFFGLENFQWFVSSDYAVGSCPYRVTLEHERSHVEAITRIFHAGRDGLVRDLEAVPVPTASAPTLVRPTAMDAEQAAVADRFKAVVVARAAAIKAAQDADRSTKDSPAAYAAVHSQCPPDSW